MSRLLSELICPFSYHVLRFFRIIESSESDTALLKEVALPYDLSFLKDSTSVYWKSIKKMLLFQNPYSIWLF